MNQVKAAIAVLFLILIALPSILTAQGGTTITQIPKNYNTFQVGGIGSLDICYRTLENKQREFSIDNLITNKNEGETVKFGYHAGIGFCMNASEHFGMEIGVIYSNRGYETKLTNYIYPQPDPTMPTQGRSIYNYNFIDVPIRANFFAGKGKVRFFASFGISTNVLVAQNETFVKKYEDGRTEYEVITSSYPLEKVVFSGTIAAGVDCKFNKNLSLRVAPHFGHNIGRFSNAPLSVYLWTTGLSASFYYGWY